MQEPNAGLREAAQLAVDEYCVWLNNATGDHPGEKWVEAMDTLSESLALLPGSDKGDVKTFCGYCSEMTAFNTESNAGSECTNPNCWTNSKGEGLAPDSPALAELKSHMSSIPPREQFPVVAAEIQEAPAFDERHDSECIWRMRRERCDCWLVEECADDNKATDLALWPAQPDALPGAPSPVSKDPVHDYILKADPQDLKEMMDAARLDPVVEAAWVKKIIDKRLTAPVLGDITALVDAHRRASLQSTMNSIGGGSLEPADTIERNARQALLSAFSALQRDRDRLREAVEFYANPRIWIDPISPDNAHTILEDDKGRRARQVMNGVVPLPYPPSVWAAPTNPQGGET